MTSQLRDYTADHRYLLEAAATAAGLAEPVAVHLDEFYSPLLKKARKGPLQPIDGVLVRDWAPEGRRYHPGVQLGLRVYEIEGIRFVRCRLPYNGNRHWSGLDFFAVGRKDYRRLYKIALRCRRDFEPAGSPPVLPADQAEVLWQNTVGYLEPSNLRRIKKYGGRAKRGVLLMGPPGNGKTMACRWVWEECRRRRWEWRLVTPDAYRHARANDTIKQLFSVEKRVIVFFDDMDLALRDRDRSPETEDQAVFLSALDGISVNEGVVFVFTSNCAPELIDRSFQRPGRLDVVLHFQSPNAVLRKRLMDSWHPEIHEAIDIDEAVASTEGFSFAEVEELKNLLILHYTEAGAWSWEWALEQFEANRQELTPKKRRRVGFGMWESANGNGVGR